MLATTRSSPVIVPATKMKPKEHGAYAILGIPIVTALFAAGATVPGICVAIAAVTGFLAHEPILVAWGHRGGRAKRMAADTRQRLAILLATTIGCGGIAFALGDASIRGTLLVCLLFSVFSFSLAVSGKHRTLGGQLWGVVALSVVCVPIMLAGDITLVVALEIWVTWLIGFSATTMAVRSVIAAQKKQSRSVHFLALTILPGLVFAMVYAGYSLALTTLPMFLLSWHLLIQPPPATKLKRVGWTLVAGTIATAVWMISLA